MASRHDDDVLSTHALVRTVESVDDLHNHTWCQLPRSVLTSLRVNLAGTMTCSTSWNPNLESHSLHSEFAYDERRSFFYSAPLVPARVTSARLGKVHLGRSTTMFRPLVWSSLSSFATHTATHSKFKSLFPHCRSFVTLSHPLSSLWLRQPRRITDNLLPHS
jgi:hypothetical protein